MPATRTAAQGDTGHSGGWAGANAVTAASGAGPKASHRADRVTAKGYVLTSAEMVIGWAAPARNSARRSGARDG